ncbi:MAG: hypothetical protein H3C64_01100 [Candidatus Kuenenia stuttgartiensis]|nr:hypothetical protein [Candidatus Kuenenia stuttgartiensis]
MNTALKTDSFIVYGNCGMCKRRIEQAAKSIVGVKIANWDTESQMLTLKYDEAVLSRNGKSLDNISIAVAETGHDTQYYKAENTAYEALPKCCLYERPEN